jgi:hypothetical protein
LVRDSAVGEGSAVSVCAAVGRIASVDVGSIGEGVFVGSGVAVDSKTGAGVKVQAARKIRATVMEIFITSNYMS